MKLKSYLIAAAVSATAALPAFADIEIEHAYVRVVSPVAKSGAAFMHIMNTGAEDDRLIGATASIAKVAELHTHIMEDGIAKMREVEGGRPVAAGDVLILERGGFHVMMMGVTPGVKEGDKITMTLTFEKAGDITIEVPVHNGEVEMPMHNNDVMHGEGMTHH